MYCGKCGAKIPDGASVCPECGAKISKNIARNFHSDEDHNKSDIDSKTADQVSRKSERIRQMMNGGRNKAGDFSKDFKEKINRSQNEEYATRTSNVQNNIDDDNISFTSDVKKAGKSGRYVLAENEQVIRSYMCAIHHTGFLGLNVMKGHLTVTNKRMLYEGASAGSRISMEAPIDSIGGIKAYNGTTFKLLRLLIGIIILIIGIRFLRSYSQSFFGNGWIWILLGIILIALSFRSYYMFSVSSNKASGTAISIGHGPITMRGYQNFYTFEARPTADAYRMMHELGALVQDVQQLGDLAIDKWKE